MAASRAHFLLRLSDSTLPTCEVKTSPERTPQSGRGRLPACRGSDARRAADRSRRADSRGSEVCLMDEPDANLTFAPVRLSRSRDGRPGKTLPRAGQPWCVRVRRRRPPPRSASVAARRRCCFVLRIVARVDVEDVERSFEVHLDHRRRLRPREVMTSSRRAKRNRRTAAPGCQLDRACRRTRDPAQGAR